MGRKPLRLGDDGLALHPGLVSFRPNLDKMIGALKIANLQDVCQLGPFRCFLGDFTGIL